MIKVLIDNPLLLLFMVAAIGYPLGRIRIRGSSLGVAAVLFVGLGIGALHPELKLPEIVYVLGLALFVYTIGLSSGPAFVASLRQDGVRNNLLILGVLVLAAALTVAAQRFLGLPGTVTAGLFAGSLTNTPALAGALETIKHLAPQNLMEQFLAEPVVGYSIAYPMGVMGVVLAISLVQKLWRIDYADEATRFKIAGAATESLRSKTIRVTWPLASRQTVAELSRQQKWDVVFGRIKRGEEYLLTGPVVRFRPGDLVLAVGAEGELQRVAEVLGEMSEEEISADRSEIDYRRIFVSNPRVAGRRLGSLNLFERFGATVTRVRRGDDDFLPHDDMVLELGDRVRVVTHCDRMGEVTALFGDSYRAVSEVDILTFSLGLALGLLLGIVPFPLPGGVTLKLGFAGGPLIVALVLGTIGRSGGMIWSLPYSANMTLRQIGLVLFLAGIGTRAGYGFVSTLAKGGGFAIFAAGAVVTCFAALTTLLVGHRLLKIPMGILIGMVAGLQTQPAVLGYALEQTGNDLPNIGYASVYPVATIGKILIVQVLLSMLM
ncbi:transporter [Geobacter hydrogenophilus]|uniref:Transporter n=1 Tax=Geobacter hydrogenophilus TaxID=40983 RepID=A0A9W6G3Z7_9BACT|nr:aspartate:alanine exchanger family transporter [Geobacter hydrogenophilus]MBT0892483.1 transporter [Geobacter hydrogenophilus]GLI39878.1 putative transporter [Geobacter hydrogenophilus]